MQTKVLTVTLLALVMATSAHAVFGAGIIRGNDYRVVVDSVKWGLRGSPFPVWETTSGWEADPSGVDTFRFQIPEDRPLWGEFKYSVAGQDTFLAVNPLEADRWFDMPVPGGLDVVPQLMYRDSLTSGLESGITPAPLPAMTARPNPFRAFTRLAIEATLSRTEVTVYDATGRRVRRLAVSSAAGSSAATWDGRDDQGSRVDPGVYIARLPGGASARLVLQD